MIFFFINADVLFSTAACGSARPHSERAGGAWLVCHMTTTFQFCVKCYLCCPLSPTCSLTQVWMPVPRPVLMSSPFPMMWVHGTAKDFLFFFYHWHHFLPVLKLLQITQVHAIVNNNRLCTHSKMYAFKLFCLSCVSFDFVWINVLFSMV